MSRQGRWSNGWRSEKRVLSVYGAWISELQFYPLPVVTNVTHGLKGELLQYLGQVESITVPSIQHREQPRTPPARC